MSERIIRKADLNIIEHNLLNINNNLNVLHSQMDHLDDRVNDVDNNLTALAQDVRQFIQYQYLSNNLQRAKTDLIEVRQTLERKFGHYELVRRTATGILQADDLGIVRQETISTATEELMLATPGYWLAPCLVALAAWISDQPELAEKALKEGIKRSDMKTSLFFLLVCRRAERKDASLQWLQRYMENQDAESLEHTAILVLDAYANGLFGVDTEGLVVKQMNAWLEQLSDKPGFVEQQTKQWSDAINAKRSPLRTASYTYLKRYSTAWPVLEDILEDAYLHERILNYFSEIFDKTSENLPLKEQLDNTLKHLVTDFDDEELPLRKQEKLDMLIIKFDGDETRAKKNMELEKSSLEIRKDFTQLLTDAAMGTTNTHTSVATQKLSIALSRDWITNAYVDLVAKNRMKIPHEIPFTMESFEATTIDGTNETELLAKFEREVAAEKEQMLALQVLSGFDQFCLYGGGAFSAVGLGMLIGESPLLGIVVALAGLGCISNHFSRTKEIAAARESIEAQFAKRLDTGWKIIRAFLAEVVDFRAEFSEKDSESQQVLDFLEQISPAQYVKKLSGTNRAIRL